MIRACEEKYSSRGPFYGLPAGVTVSAVNSCQFCSSADLRRRMSPGVLPRNCPIIVAGGESCCRQYECREMPTMFRKRRLPNLPEWRSPVQTTGGADQFEVKIKAIRRRRGQLITGYWFNIIEINGYQFLQWPLESSSNEDDLALALAFASLQPDEIGGFWPEVLGYPLTEDEQDYFKSYISAKDGKDVELVIPLRNQARPVSWVNFEDSREYHVYAESIYPEIMKAIRDKSFHCLLDVGCGSGNLLQAFRSQYPDACFYGLDISPGNVESAREKGFSHVYEGNARLLEKAIPGGIMFDLIIFSGVLNRQIMDAGDAKTIIEKSLDLLAPGGHILITGYSSCHLRALDLAKIGLNVLIKSIPANIFRKYDSFYLRQLYLTRKEIV